MNRLLGTLGMGRAIERGSGTATAVRAATLAADARFPRQLGRRRHAAAPSALRRHASALRQGHERLLGDAASGAPTPPCCGKASPPATASTPFCRPLPILGGRADAPGC